MAQSLAVLKFAGDINDAIDLGGRKGFIRAMNLSLRATGMFGPLSDHKAIRSEQARNASWTRQNSRLHAADLPMAKNRRAFHEFGKAVERAERVKPSEDLFERIANMMGRRKITPNSARGKGLLLDAKQDGSSHLKVGVQGWYSQFRSSYATSDF